MDPIFTHLDTFFSFSAENELTLVEQREKITLIIEFEEARWLGYNYWHKFFQNVKMGIKDRFKIDILIEDLRSKFEYFAQLDSSFYDQNLPFIKKALHMSLCEQVYIQSDLDDLEGSKD